MLKPRRLERGDKVATVSLSWGGPGAIAHRYEVGKRQLEAEFGVKVVEMPHTLADPEWLARHPQARAEDLMQAFRDAEIKAIFSTIGGDDSIRLLPYVDLDVIAANPKIFMGYSDTTVSHFACFRAGLVSFYGPSVMAGFGENVEMFPYMVHSVRRTLFDADAPGQIKPNKEGWTVELLDWNDPQNQSRRRKLNPAMDWRYLQGEGVHRGHLLGGCLEVLDWLRGTELWPGNGVWEGAILFLETSEEAPSPDDVARQLRVLAAMGILQRLAGILFGRPGGEMPVAQFEKYDEALLQVVGREEGLNSMPIISRMDFGHTDPMFVLPYGIQAEINCDQQQFSICEPAVI